MANHASPEVSSCDDLSYGCRSNHRLGHRLGYFPLHAQYHTLPTTGAMLMVVGEEVEVDTIPPCDFCQQFSSRRVKAKFDGATKPNSPARGSWAYMCGRHHARYGVGVGRGKGQRLILVGR